MGVIRIQFALRRPMFNILNSLTVCTLVITVTLTNAKPWDEYTEVSVEELYPPEEAKVTELESVDEVDAQLIKQLEELLNVDELSDVEEVDVQEVVNKEEVSKLTPLSNVEEVVDIQEVVSKTLVPDAVAKKFLKWKKQRESGYNHVNPYEEEKKPKYDSYETSAYGPGYVPGSKYGIHKKIDILDKQLITAMKRLKKIEEVIHKLEIKYMDEIIEMEKVRKIETVNKMEEVKKMEEVVEKEELESLQEIKKKEDVISMEPVKNIETVVSLNELSPSEVKKLKQMLRKHKNSYGGYGYH